MRKRQCAAGRARAFGAARARDPQRRTRRLDDEPPRAAEGPTNAFYTTKHGTSSDDAAVLERAAAEGRLVLTHDVSTLIGFAWKRVASGRRHSGVAAVSQQAPVGAVISDLLLLVECGTNEEWADRVLFIPF